MQQVGIFDAKTRFSELVDTVNTTGEPVLVTKRGKPVAQIMPPPADDTPKLSREELVAKVRELRPTYGPFDPEEIRSAIEEGRR